jgi:hypothetical protein
MKAVFETVELGSWTKPVSINPNGEHKLAIFGDSFGANSDDILFDQWWPTKLAKLLEVKEYINYCRPETSFYFSYTNFVKNYRDNDINIVLVTSPHRYTKSVSIRSSSNVRLRSTIISNIHKLEYLRKSKTLTDEGRQLLNYLEGWFMSADDNYMDAMHSLMINHIISLDPNVILIPCFSDSIQHSMLNIIGLNVEQHLYEIVRMQHKSLGSKRINIISEYLERSTIITCHFTPETSTIVTDLVFERIKTGKWNWNLPEDIKHNHTLEHYYEQRTI